MLLRFPCGGIVRCNGLLGSAVEENADSRGFSMVLQSFVSKISAFKQSLHDIWAASLERTTVEHFQEKLVTDGNVNFRHLGFGFRDVAHAVDPRVPVVTVETSEAHLRRELPVKRCLVRDRCPINDDSLHVSCAQLDVGTLIGAL